MNDELYQLLVRWIHVQHPNEVFECTSVDVWNNYYEGVGAMGSEAKLISNLKEFFNV